MRAGMRAVARLASWRGAHHGSRDVAERGRAVTELARAVEAPAVRVACTDAARMRATLRDRDAADAAARDARGCSERGAAASVAELAVRVVTCALGSAAGERGAESLRKVR